ncbi:amidase signature enzyme [Cadophora sp. DSE1049]|nr:amidase signature enzyme [Cadophora sp. DSE1049]
MPQSTDATPASSTGRSLLGITIGQVSDGLSSGHFTSVDLVKAYIARIEETREFNAVIQVNPDAVSIAKSLDGERVRSGSRGPLHGVPFLVKDNIVTADKLDVSAGSFALLGAKPAMESSLVTRLRNAGVIILGKSNLSEWANFRATNSSSGWSPRGGQTMGTYYPNSNPAGSSSGSAVGTALGLCTAALGTETAGSIIGPAQTNNDVVGPLTSTVKDAAYILNVLAGRSEMDSMTWDIPFDPIPDFTEDCRSTDLTGLSIEIPRNSFVGEIAPPILHSFELGMDILRSAGAKVIDNTNFEAAEEFRKLDRQARSFVQTSEFKTDMNAYLTTLESNPHNIRTVNDIIAFTKSFPAEEYPERDIEKFLWTTKEGTDVDSPLYKTYREREAYYGGGGGILGAMEKHNLDLLVVPSTASIPNSFAAKMGFPIISIPLGRGNLVEVGPGIPYCITFISKSYSDSTLLKVAYAFEQISQVKAKGPKPFKLPETELRHVQVKDQKI